MMMHDKTLLLRIRQWCARVSATSDGWERPSGGWVKNKEPQDKIKSRHYVGVRD